MDNRRIVKSYRDKIKNAALPHGSRNSFFSRFISFFNKSRSQIEDGDTVEQETQGLTEKSPGNGRSGPEMIWKLPATPVREFVASESKTPNNILSDFFKEKGSTPLTEVEYEGVVSLLSRSTDANPEVTNSLKKRAPIHQSSDRPLKLARRNETPDIETSSVSDYTTPFQQRTLKYKTSGDRTLEFLTPEYKPTYHSVNEQHRSRNVPSIKRVYQFSGVPSPYSTHIRTPRPLSSQDSEISNSEPTKNITEDKPISNAANTLLSILDDNETESSNSAVKKNNIVDKTKKFSNPFTHPRTKNTKKLINVTDSTDNGGTQLTASDINKTISYSASQELPNQNVPSDNHTKDMARNLRNTGSQLESTEFETKKSTGFLPNKESTVAQQTSDQIEKPISKQSGFTVKPNPAPQSSTFSFTTNGDAEKNQNSSNPFNLEVKPEKSNSFKPTTSLFTKDNLTKTRADCDEFTFPETHNISAKLDRVKVDFYKSMFNF